MAKTLTYQEIVARLNDRVKSASKQATAGSGAPGTPSVQVTEKDPQDTGTVQIPKDPSTSPKQQNLPGSGADSHPNHNTDVTPVKAVGATAPAETVTADEGAGSAAKAAKVTAAIKNFRVAFKSAASEKLDVKAPAAEGKPASMVKEAPKAAAELTPTDKGKHPVVNKDKTAQGPKTEQVTEKDPQEESKPKVREDAIGGVPEKAVTNENVKGNENTDKAAALEFDPSYHFKLASIVLADTDLRNAAEAKLQEALGAEVASDIIKAAAVMEQEANAIAELEAAGAFEAEELWKSASVEERATITKLAALHDYVRGKLATEVEKQAYDMGASAAADEMDQPPMPAGPEGAAPGPEGAAPGPEGAGEVTPEDIMAVLQQLVESGQLDEQTAQAILTELSGGGAPEGAAPEGAAPEGAPGQAEAEAAAAAAGPEAEAAEAGGPGHAEPDADDAGVPPEIKEMAAKGASVVAKLITKPATK